MSEEKTPLGRELEVVTRALTEIDAVSAGLADLRQKYSGVVYDVTTTAGMLAARASRTAVRDPRYNVERIRKEAKRPIIDLGKKLDAEAARITAALREIEDPIDAQITVEEERKEQEKRAREQAEQQRVAKLQERVAELRGNRTLSVFAGSAHIAEHVEDLQRIPVDDSFEEFKQQAEDAKGAGLAWLRELHAAALAHEAEQARIATERAELDRLRREQAERDAAERKRQAEEAELGRMRMQEIQSIQYQVMIASGGCLGVRKGGTRECIVDTLAETRAWTITEENFGPLLSIAQSTKDSAIAQIEQLLVQWDKSAEEKRIDAIRNRIQAIRVADGISRRPATIIQKEIDDVRALTIDDNFAEFKDEAQAAQDETVRCLTEILDERKAYEAEQAQLAAQRAELDRIEREQREAREAEEARVRTEQQAEAARLAAAREEIDRIEAQKKEEREAEERRLEEQRAELVRQQDAWRKARDGASALAAAAETIPAVAETITATPETTEPQDEIDPVDPGSEPCLEQWAEHAFEEIDAGFFSADTFHSPEALARAEWYLARWQREIASIKKMLAEDETVEA